MKESLINDRFPIALFSAFEFSKGTEILWIGTENSNMEEILFGYFRNRGINLSFANLDDSGNIIVRAEGTAGGFDYTIVTSLFETLSEKEKFVTDIKSLLKHNGTLMLAINNPLGIRFLVGDKDPYTDRNFDGIESYIRMSQYDKKKLLGQMLDYSEVTELLKRGGFYSSVQFSVFPNLQYPQLIYREDMFPNEDIASRILPLYNSPETIFLDEYQLLNKLQKNGLFHEFANAYIIECSLDNRRENMRHATININRGYENAMSTVIRENGIVEKIPVFSEGIKSLEKYKENHDVLYSRGVNAIPVELTNRCARTEFIDGIGGIEYFRKLFKVASRDKFVEKVDEFKEIIIQSSDYEICQDTNDIILKNGYIDLSLINCIYKNDIPYFIDQEYVINNLPAKVLITRLVDYVYFGNDEMEKKFPRQFFDDRYELGDNLDVWRRFSSDFLNKLKNANTLRPFYEKHCTTADIINANRQRMNYPQEEYKRLFEDIFAGLDNKKLYLFGSGLFAERFINLYGRYFYIEGIIDNDSAKWGMTKCDICISSPDTIFSKEPSEYKVIVCIKNYTAVLSQLKIAGVKNISIFDPNAIYDIKRALYYDKRSVDGQKVDEELLFSQSDVLKNKKYNVGYIAGVFDLFHIGHLNLLRRAKEQCNHLIVGVVNDEAVVKNKRVEPFVPFGERIEMVRACKYVDEAVEITYTNAGTKDAYRLYHFDVQFSGSDYVNNGYWLAEKEFLEKNGAELVFFPYTEQTSSSKIKKLIDEKLI